MNPKLDTYFWNSLHGQFFGFHSLIIFLKATTIVNSFNSKGTISEILRPKYKILPLTLENWLYFWHSKTWIIFITRLWKISLKMGGDRFRCILNISVANFCRFLVCIITDLSDLSLMRTHTIFTHLIQF